MQHEGFRFELNGQPVYLQHLSVLQKVHTLRTGAIQTLSIALTFDSPGRSNSLCNWYPSHRSQSLLRSTQHDCSEPHLEESPRRGYAYQQRPRTTTVDFRRGLHCEVQHYRGSDSYSTNGST